MDVDDEHYGSLDGLLREVARAPAMRPSPTLPAGTIINGTFRSERRLGAGGMGVVFLARDLRLDRDVVLKLHGAGAGAAPDAAARIAREAANMARLVHPNVIMVYETGTYDGRVFIVMEYLDGGTLRAWLDERPRGWREIVGRFALAGAGLAAAHEGGLVHHDFKPENVLLGKDGRVRVADFGLARPDPAGAKRPDSDSGASDPIGVAGTPAYMSPEQRRGEPADPRSDQYSFCVALDEALAHASGVPHRLRRALSRGLQLDPARRFASMTDVLAEIERSLRRRRAAFVIGGLTIGVAVVVAAAVAGSSGAEPCAGSRDRLGAAWDPARRARVRDALAASELVASFAPGLVAELDRYGDAWVAMHREACVATRVRREQSELLLDARMACLDRSRAQLERATELLADPDEVVLEHADEIVGALPSVARCAQLDALRGIEPPPTDPRLASEVEAVRRELGGIRAVVSAGKGASELGGVDPLIERARATAYAPILAEALQVAADDHHRGGRNDLAEPVFREAITAALAGGTDDDAATAMSELGFVLGQMTRFTEAEEWFARAQGMLARIGGLEEVEAILTGNHADALRRAGRYADAEVAARRAVQLRRHLDGVQSRSAGDSLTTLGSVLAEAGKSDEAKRTLVEAVAILQAAIGPDHPVTLLALMDLAWLCVMLGDAEEATRFASRALDAQLARYGDDDPRLSNALSIMAMSLRISGKRTEALAMLERSHALELRAQPLDHDDMAQTLGNIAILQIELRDLSRAAESAAASLAEFERALGPEHPRIVQPQLLLGTLQRNLDRHADSARTLAGALALAERALPVDHPERVNAQVELALTDLELGKPADAVALLEPAVAILEGPGWNPGNLAEARFALARALRDARRDRPRSRQLAVAARDGYAALGEGFDQQRTEIVTWLADHPPEADPTERGRR